MRKGSLKALGILLTFMVTLNTYAQIDRKPVSFQGILKQGDDLLIDQQVYFRLGL